ncbi:MAG: sigma-70 family RNA polymerase sigma factor [bacterium]|nr:sigma-70 family RNA polymerase sigma factor [bacterium]
MARPETATTEGMADHGARVLRTIWNLASSTEEAQDIFQETFLQHHLAITRGHTIDNTAAWLRTTAHGRRTASSCAISSASWSKCATKP